MQFNFVLASFELHKEVPKGHARTISFTGGSQTVVPEKNNLACVIKKESRILADSEYEEPVCKSVCQKVTYTQSLKNGLV